ncbi:hypothetical protein PCANB_000819 [Pneumocystis canis]|nr:hypothetical protein PCANB_000819 [Pneumocystis canis]
MQLLSSENTCSSISFFDKKYEIIETKQFISDKGFLRVALQFPDSLLKDAFQISARLSENSNVNFFILGDTSYGNCCVDEIAAQHVQAECIIHYGHACLSTTERLPVKYILGKQELDIEQCIKAFETIYQTQNQIILTGDSYSNNIIDEIKNILISRGYHGIIYNENKFNLIQIVETINKHIMENQEKVEPLNNIYNELSIFYIGKDSPALVTFAMTCYSHVSSFYSYDPKKQTVIHQSPFINTQLRRRYAIIQKAKDASVIGIIVGTLGVSKYLQVIHHIRKIIQKAGRKSYLFVIGKLSPEKLANFPEIELFVLVSCPENSLIESKNFYRPITTPYELCLALSSKNWNKNWITDFSSILSLKLDEENISYQDEPHFSLITGRLMQLSVMEKNETLIKDSDFKNHYQDIIKTNESTQLLKPYPVHSMSANFHKETQNWYGLSKIEEHVKATLLETGQQGIASEYHNEYQF